MPRTSPLLMAGLGAGHLALGVAFVFSSLPTVAIVVALAGLLGGLIFNLWRWRGGGGWHLLLRQDGSLRVTSSLGQSYEANAQGRSRELGWAVWLVWGATEGRVHGVLMIPKDALPAEDWRALRIWMRFLALGPEDGPK